MWREHSPWGINVTKAGAGCNRPGTMPVEDDSREDLVGDDATHAAYPRQFKGNACVAFFSHRRMLADFAYAFVDLRILRDTLRFDAAELLERTFVTEDLHEGGRDVVWNVPAAGDDLGVFFLIEHQSAVNHSMPMRLLEYMQAIWRDFQVQFPADARRTKDFRWPLIVPIVFYTGRRPWTGAMRLPSLVTHGAEFSDRVPDFAFQLIDVAATGDEELACPGNVACAILRLLRVFVARTKLEEYGEAIRAIARFPKTPEMDSIKRVVYHYIVAHDPPEQMRRYARTLFSGEGVMQEPDTEEKTVFELWAEELEAKGRTEKQAEDLRDGIAAIARLFERKSLSWETYACDIESITTPHDAMVFMVDIAAATDPAAFLRTRFGH